MIKEKNNIISSDIQPITKYTSTLTVSFAIAAKGSRKTRNNSGLTVTGYVMRNGERVKRTELSVKEQRRLSTVWSLKSMDEAGFVPVTERKLETGVVE